jgi:nucleotide-binding universal stress UspA family protein
MEEGNNNLKTIVVAQDGSPAARAAANTAIHIAQHLKLEVRGLYIVDESMILDTYVDHFSELRRTRFVSQLNGGGTLHSRNDLVDILAERGHSTLRWLKDRCRIARVNANSELLVGGITTMILRKSRNAFLLALGRRGLRYAGDPHRLGHHFRAIAHHAHLPLLVGGSPIGTLHRLLLGYNNSENAQRALDFACQLQRSLSIEMTILGVHEGDDESVTRHWLTEARARLEEQEATNYHFSTKKGRVAQEIAKTAAKTRSNLIVMGGYRHNALIEWIVGSTLDQVLRNTQLPVLTA